MMQAVGGSALAVALAGCTDLFSQEDEGGNTGTEEVPDEPIEAGLQTFQEGAPAVLGLNAEYGARTAVRRINNAGGVAGREINLEVVEEAGAAIENYERFVDEGKDVTFGPISSGSHEQMVPSIEEQGVINVSTDGTVTTLYEEEFTDVTYSFRHQNHDVMEALSAARTAVEQLGAENIDTWVNVNPDYAFGHDERDVFNTAMEKLTDGEEVYDGRPELGASDMSTHVAATGDEAPDVVFTSLWGGDATLFLSQGQSSDIFDDVGIVVGPVLYGSANDMNEGDIEGNIWAGSRNFYWGSPPANQWTPGEDLFMEAMEEHDSIPTAHFMSGYGAVAQWATAAEKATNIVGGWPSQEQISQVMEGHGFFTPAGYHTVGPDHQTYSTAHFGRLEWGTLPDGSEGPLLEDVSAIPPSHVSPPNSGFGIDRETSFDWIESW